MNVFKQPVTDLGKKSKKGRLTLEYENGKYKTVEEGKGDPKKVYFCVVLWKLIYIIWCQFFVSEIRKIDSFLPHKNFQS